MDEIFIDFVPARIEGRFRFHGDPLSPNWQRVQFYGSSKSESSKISLDSIQLPWAEALGIVRSLAPLQKRSGFRLVPGDSHTRRLVHDFVRTAQEFRVSRQQSAALPSQEEKEEIVNRLRARNFIRRSLTDFQLRDLHRLMNISHGANFSVPGTGKTTVTIALNCLLGDDFTHQLVIGPKAAFPAWSTIIDECFEWENQEEYEANEFKVIRSGDESIRWVLQSGHKRFVTNYEAFVGEFSIFREFLRTNRVHLVLDESHRMKAGKESSRGAALLSVATLPVRKDILSGTPMPQSITDLESQMEFLWPGTGIGRLIHDADSPRSVVGGLYVRTKKSELGLKRPNVLYEGLPMADGQLALYGLVRLEALKQLSSLRSGDYASISAAKKSVLRLLQLTVIPAYALKSLLEGEPEVDSGLVDKVLAEKYSPKVLRAVDIAKQNSTHGRKTVIWTIFNETVDQLEFLLADLGAVVINGSVPSGLADDPCTREGRLRRFHEDGTCSVLIANPAAAGEGISLHQVCHDAVYVDRSFNATHFLQSIDRIHRLGLPESTETNITILQALSPLGLGSIDASVKRRLAVKIRGMQELLDDEDLHLLALDEEESDDPIDGDTSLEDLMDLIRELEGRPPSDTVAEDEFYS